MQRASLLQVAKKGDWKEGQLFPEGWEDMGALEKGWQLWAGTRGFLFWSTKLAFGSIITLIGVWILFRFVGPALGDSIEHLTACRSNSRPVPAFCS